MKKLIIILLILNYQLSIITAQNLVPNPSFEEYSECPDNLGQTDKLMYWNNYNYYNSPDYYNECGFVSAFGHQEPYTGKGYIGIYTYSYDYPIEPYYYHEIVYTELLYPMVVNDKYFVSIKVSFAENLGLCASNKLGVLFTTYYDTTKSVVNNFSQIYTNSIITDTLNWVTISGSFIADSNYNYIYIGNFFHDSLTNTSQASNCFAYYYIDDVCVCEDSLFCNSLSIANPNTKKFNIYPNPFSNIINIEIYNGTLNINTVELIDIIGRKYPISTIKNNNNITITPKTNIKNGIYLLKIQTNKSTILKKLIKK